MVKAINFNDQIVFRNKEVDSRIVGNNMLFLKCKWSLKGVGKYVYDVVFNHQAYLSLMAVFIIRVVDAQALKRILFKLFLPLFCLRYKHWVAIKDLKRVKNL